MVPTKTSFKTTTKLPEHKQRYWYFFIIKTIHIHWNTRPWNKTCFLRSNSECHVRLKRTKNDWNKYNSGIIWKAILVKSQDLIVNGPYVLWKVEILSWTFQIYYGRSKFYYKQSKYIMTGRDVIINRRNTLRQVEIFMMTGPDFTMSSRDILW